VTRGKLIGGVLVMVALAVLVVSSVALAASVSPITHSGNTPRGCDLKIEDPTTGVYSIPGRPGKTISITVSSYQGGEQLAFSSDLPVLKAYMKGGDGYNEYDYGAQGTMADSGLVCPLNNGGNVPAISHVSFCFGEEATTTSSTTSTTVSPTSSSTTSSSTTSSSTTSSSNTSTSEATGDGGAVDDPGDGGPGGDDQGDDGPSDDEGDDQDDDGLGDDDLGDDDGTTPTSDSVVGGESTTTTTASEVGSDEDPGDDNPGDTGSGDDDQGEDGGSTGSTDDGTTTSDTAVGGETEDTTSTSEVELGGAEQDVTTVTEIQTGVGDFGGPGAGVWALGLLTLALAGGVAGSALRPALRRK